MVEKLSKYEIKNLRRTARKFLKDKSKTDEEKIDILFLFRVIVGLFRLGVACFE